MKKLSQPVTPCVSGLFARKKCVLLVRRRNPPHQGEWSLPGGRLEDGETVQQALVREMAEETDMYVRNASPFTTTKVSDKDCGNFQIHCYRIQTWTGIAKAYDDATHIMWVPIRQLRRFINPKTLKIIHKGLKVKIA